MSESGKDDPKKAEIHVLDNSGSVDEKIKVQINPSEYKLDRSVSYGDQALPGQDSPITQFVSGDARTLSMEFLFDVYGPDGPPDKPRDVRTLTDRIDRLLQVDTDSKAPPVVKFVWGSIEFTSVIESANTRFTMFLRDGTPVRAWMDVTFREYATPTDRLASDSSDSNDEETVHVVQEGDTLWAIADAEYDDPYKWRTIAEENGIEDPRTLQPGTELTIPPLEG